MSDPRVFAYACECSPGCDQRIALRHDKYLARSAQGPVIARVCAFRQTLSVRMSEPSTTGAGGGSLICTTNGRSPSV